METITNEILAHKIDTLAAVVNKIDETVNGNGHPGMKVRIDRLEQVESTRKWTVRALVMTVLGGAASYFFNFK